VIQAAGRIQIRAVMCEALKHPEHDGADKGEGEIRGYNAQFADQRTDKSHWEVSLVQILPAVTPRLANRSGR
jgi:hypothetical protein